MHWLRLLLGKHAKHILVWWFQGRKNCENFRLQMQKDADILYMVHEPGGKILGILRKKNCNIH